MSTTHTSPQFALTLHKQYRRRRRTLAGLLFVLPSLAFVSFLFILPLCMTAWMSLHDWPLFGASHFIGLQNYQNLLSDGTFWGSLAFTTKYTIILTFIVFLLAYALALLVRHPAPGVALFRTAYFLPVVTGFAASSLLWLWLFNDQVGAFDGILQRLGLIKDPILWLGDPSTALIAITVVVTWKTVGFTMVLLVVGMQAIPAEILDAAKIDGTGRWTNLRYVTVPLLRRTFALALVINVITSYLSFDPFYVMTRGGPDNQTLTVVYWIYDNSFTYFRLGYGAALSMVLLAILLVISTVQLYLLREDAAY